MKVRRRCGGAPGSSKGMCTPAVGVGQHLPRASNPLRMKSSRWHAPLPCFGSGQAHRWKGSKPRDVFAGTLWWGKVPANPSATMWTRTPLPRPFVTFSRYWFWPLWKLPSATLVSWSSTRLLGSLRPRPEYDCARQSPGSWICRSRDCRPRSGLSRCSQRCSLAYARGPWRLW